jgi:hypothetical protein
MADHEVTLMYAANGFAANPPKIKVRPGQTIAFSLAPGSLKGKIRVVFEKKQFFATKREKFKEDGTFFGGDGDIKVTAALSGPTSYECELLDDQGKVIAKSPKAKGGEVLPDTLEGN